MDFKIESAYKPTGDQPQAIEELCNGLKNGADYQTLLGVTGSGKTFTMANIIERVNRPTLILSHNKTLAAQLYAEFKSFFPKNRCPLFRFLLRLLPTRGIHSIVRQIYREGLDDKRRDRPFASCRNNSSIVGQTRCGYRFIRVVSVRHWQSGGLRQERSRNKSGNKK